MDHIVKQLEELLANAKTRLELRQSLEEAHQDLKTKYDDLQARYDALLKSTLPTVEVTGTVLDKSDAHTLFVQWDVLSSTDKPLKVNVQHTDTATGKDVSHTWDVSGRAGAPYGYAVSAIPNGARFVVLPGEGYAVKGSPVKVMPAAVAAPLPIPTLTAPTPITFPNINFGTPFKITKGGTYKGDWESKLTEVPAVDVLTNEPVIIENSTVAGAGYLIKHWANRGNIIVRNTKGIGLTPTTWVDYKKPRRFLTLASFVNVIVENCELLGTAGILLGGTYEGNGTAANTFKIRYNKVRNIDGRLHNNGSDRVQFFQGNFRKPISFAEVAWNEVINEAGKSMVEDNINLYNIRGTQANPISIHNNYIQGAYPMPHTNSVYSGGGIISDSAGATADQATAFVHIHNNQTVNLGNYNYAIAAGNNIMVEQNRAINSGLFDDGTPMMTHNSGIYGHDYYKKGATFNAMMRNNLIGVMTHGKHFHEEYFPDGTVKRENNTYLTVPITKEMEKLEFALWQQKLRDKQVRIGNY